jgi:cell division protein FtsZ
MREMGKAMMGTGEASGDKRAILAAEAAIANPLLDEVSMKGARGLLISITGGNDLTLYEVDEAASRIRQEVDEDANIILGATFDESLDGIVRVSVVATGIDKMPDQRDLMAAEARIADAAARLRIQSQARKPEPTQAALAYAEPPQAPPGYAPAPSATGVHLQPVVPQPAPAYAEPRPAQREQERRYDAGPYIPPAPEAPVGRPQRMPQIEDLPLPVQNQIRQHHAVGDQSEVKRRTLLERLAAFGMSRQDEPAAAPERPQAQLGYQPQPQRSAPGAVHSEYAKRPAAPPPQHRQPLDHHGRVAAPQQRMSEDDQLEIPAFLRRQGH